MIRWQVATRVGDPARHPNEDAWSADPGDAPVPESASDSADTSARALPAAFAVCDGVTSTPLPDGSYPSWAGGARAAWLAAAAIVATAPTRGLAAALATADRQIGALNAARDDGQIDYWQHDAYNTTTVAALIRPDGSTTIAAVGDAVALLRPADGAMRTLTRFQTDGAEHLRDELLKLGGMSERDRTVLFRTELRNRVEPWRGRGGLGFGVLDGTGRFAPLVEWIELSLAPGDVLYLCSDTTGRCLDALAAAGEHLPPTAAAAIARARGWELETNAAYPDDLTALLIER